MKYFTINELCVSGSYPKLVEVPKEGTKEYLNLKVLIDSCLDPIREHLKGPVTVTSGYRPPKLNTAVGGSKTSAHLKGLAADIHFGNNSTDNVKIIQAAIASVPHFDQIIAEGAVFNPDGSLKSCKWVHVGLSTSNPRKQILWTSDMKTYKALTITLRKA